MVSNYEVRQKLCRKAYRVYIIDELKTYIRQSIQMQEVLMSTEKIVTVVERKFRELLFQIDTEFESFKIMVKHNPSIWENPLPDSIKILDVNNGRDAVIVIGIQNWTREESYYDKESGGMFVRTAFGGDENSALIPSSDIVGIMDEKGNVVYFKTYNLIAEKQGEKPSVTTEEGTKYSMKMLMEKNKHLTKKKKGD